MPAGGAPGWRLAGELTDAGLRFALTILLATWGGWKLDGWLHSRPWGTLAGALAGFAAALYWLVHRVRQLGREAE